MLTEDHIGVNETLQTDSHIYSDNKRVLAGGDVTSLTLSNPRQLLLNVLHYDKARIHKINDIRSGFRQLFKLNINANNK